MTQPFVGGATGNPKKTRFRIAQQTTEGVPAVANFADFRAYGGGMPLESKLIQRLALNLNAEPLKKLMGKLGIDPGTIFIGDMDVANKGMVQMLVNLFGAYATSTPGTGATRWHLSAGGATAAAPFFTLLRDNDVNWRARFRDCKTSAVNLSASPNSNYEIQLPMVAGQVDFHGTPVQTAGTGSTLPILSKLWSGNLVDDAVDKDIFLKIISAASKTLKAKIASASTYDGAALTYVLAQHLGLTDETDAIIGLIAEQISAYFATGATLADNDEFQIPKRMAAWSPSLGTERPVSSINTFFWLNGELKRMEGGWQIAGVREGVERLEDVSGRQTARVVSRGDLVFRITPSRELADLDLQTAILNQGTLPVFVDAKLDAEIASSGLPYRVIWGFPACTVGGKTFDSERGATNRQESLVLEAGVPDAGVVFDGITFTTAASCVIDTDFSALA